MIIAVEFKVNNERAVQFRKWANGIVRDYTIKGWVMNDKCLKQETYLAEKYFGEQLECISTKSYIVDFLVEKRAQNKGEIQMFYVEGDYDAIISKRIWKCVQLEIKRRKKYLEEHGTNSYFHRTESNPFASKIVCGQSNKVFARKRWWSSTGVDQKVWQCSEKYKESWAVLTDMWRKNIDKGLFDGVEFTGGEPRGFRATVDQCH